MGSLISLTLGGLEIDWGKNNGFINHAKLFLRTDRKIVESYSYEGNQYEKFGFSRRLIDVLPRLELNGYSMGRVEEIYKSHQKDYPDYLPSIDLEFSDFAAIIKNITITERTKTEEDGDYDLGEYASKAVFSLPEFSEFANLINVNNHSVMSFFENLDPYIQLRLLAENPKNFYLDLNWHTQDVVEGGWTTEDELFGEWQDTREFLIITEGSSDTFIIKEAINYLRPDIQDFFKYIDMTEHYPFSGTGNLFNFYQGLARIGIKNNCLVIFDNDSEGVEKFDKIQGIPTPSSLHAMILPILEEFTQFKTIGPDGPGSSDINGKAVSIECFLDLTYKNCLLPTVRWTNYKKNQDSYQGALESKEHYISQFKKGLSDPRNYNFEKLNVLIDHIYKQCISMG